MANSSSTQFATTPRYDRLPAGAVQRSNEKWMRDRDCDNFSASMSLCFINSLTTQLRAVFALKGSRSAASVERSVIIFRKFSSSTIRNAWRLVQIHMVIWRLNFVRLTMCLFAVQPSRKSLTVSGLSFGSSIVGWIGESKGFL